jgi:aminoglycoside/choline kinase family phosphotransferase
MDAPPPQEDPQPFIAVAQWLSAQGFNAPQILAQDLANGLVLLEDFGDMRMREALDADPSSEVQLYRDVVALLVALHSRPAMALAPYDRDTYQRESSLFTEWYCPALELNVDIGSFISAWDEVLQVVLSDTRPAVTVLRDYHAENVMLVGGRTGIGRLGLLDFQDALAGHPAYDLVSLLQDARRDVSETLERDMINYYNVLEKHSENFDDVYHILGAQRNVKILGIFTRLWKRDGKRHYCDFQPRVWRYLERDLAHPALAPVNAWFKANVPPEMRASRWITHAP